MFSMLAKYRPVYDAADAGGGAAAAAAVAAVPAADATPKADAGSVLYPDDPAKPAVDPAKPAGDTPAADWKEFVADPAKTADENAAAKAEHDKTKPAADPLDVVPADGKYALTMPEGVTVDQALLDELSPEFKAAGLTGKQAQALADKYIARKTAEAKAQGEAWAKTTSDWVDAAKADPEIGGAKWDGTVKAASGIVGRFGNDALKEYLNASGAGNHPEMIRFMAKVGAMIGEDKPAISETPGSKVKADSATILYPDDQPKGK